MFYFHREILTGIDNSHITGLFPPFQQRFALWEVVFQKAIPNVFDLTLTNASALNVIPSLMLNPSQDYQHLKDRRAAIENNGYLGLRAPSSRVRGSGNMIVLFEDQSKNVQRITPFQMEFRMITSVRPPAPFTNHALELLDFTAGEVQIILPNPTATPHPAIARTVRGREWSLITSICTYINLLPFVRLTFHTNHVDLDKLLPCVAFQGF